MRSAGTGCSFVFSSTSSGCQQSPRLARRSLMSLHTAASFCFVSFSIARLFFLRLLGAQPFAIASSTSARVTVPVHRGHSISTGGFATPRARSISTSCFTTAPRSIVDGHSSTSVHVLPSALGVAFTTGERIGCAFARRARAARAASRFDPKYIGSSVRLVEAAPWGAAVVESLIPEPTSAAEARRLALGQHPLRHCRRAPHRRGPALAPALRGGPVHPGGARVADAGVVVGARAGGADGYVGYSWTYPLPLIAITSAGVLSVSPASSSVHEIASVCSLHSLGGAWIAWSA